MKIKRYFAADMRQALRKVREAQGSDAVILSNRKIDGGVEIVAAVDYDESLLDPGPPPARDPVPTASVSPLSKAPDPAATPVQAPPIEPVRERIEWSQDPSIAALRAELQSMRGLLEQQLSGLAWGEMGRRSPQRASMLRRLLSLQIEPDLARDVVAQIPEGADLEPAWRKALTVLAQQLKTQDDPILADGGVVALVGPTGVGKTTTVAKLAARFALRHGPDQVALVTTDNFRVGAVEQLRTFGRIMNVPVRVTKGQDELRNALDELYDRRLVLIDTAGMSQRDIRLSEQLSMIQDGAPLVRNYLVLSATTQTLGLDEAVRAFRSVQLDGCIITKLDEATGLGNMLSTVIRQRLPVVYVSDGQRVPEDIQPARAHRLVSQAVGIMQKSSQGDADESLELAYGSMAADGRL